MALYNLLSDLSQTNIIRKIIFCNNFKSRAWILHILIQRLFYLCVSSVVQLSVGKGCKTFMYREEDSMYEYIILEILRPQFTQNEIRSAKSFTNDAVLNFYIKYTI